MKTLNLSGDLAGAFYEHRSVLRKPRNPAINIEDVINATNAAKLTRLEDDSAQPNQKGVPAATASFFACCVGDGCEKEEGMHLGVHFLDSVEHEVMVRSQ